jgi:hypothetical protein
MDVQQRSALWVAGEGKVQGTLNEGGWIVESTSFDC